jgi:hypothetical protein
MKGSIDALAERVETQNGRITALERARWLLTGGLVLLSFLWPLLIYEFRQSIAQALGG